MPTDWGPVVQTGVGASAALAGGFIGAWVQGRNQQRAERDRRREQVGAVLAEVRALLTEIQPDPLGLFANVEMFQQVFPPLRERWQRIRIPLLTMSTAGQSEQVRALARQLEQSASSTLVAVAVFVGDVVESHDHQDTREEANRRHGQATSLLTQLEEAIQPA